jgi:hypothetical protein
VLARAVDLMAHPDDVAAIFAPMPRETASPEPRAPDGERER